MKKSISFPTITAIVFACLFTAAEVRAQKSPQVTEPPIPVYIVCPYHQDSLRIAYESSVSAHGPAFAYAIRKYDSLQVQMQKSSAETSAHFTWVYIISCTLGCMNVVLLLLTARMKKEIESIRKSEKK